MQKFLTILLIFLCSLSMQTSEVRAQEKNIWLDSGRLNYRVEYNNRSRRRANSYELDHNMVWPADYKKSPAYYNEAGGNVDLFMVDFQHPWENSFSEAWRHNIGTAYPGDQNKIIRYPYPIVTVNGEQAGSYDSPSNILDPSINCDQIGYAKTYSKIGIDCHSTIYSWSHPDYQDFVIEHLMLVNSGAWRQVGKNAQSEDHDPNDWSQVWLQRTVRHEPGSIADYKQNEWAYWNYWWDETDDHMKMMYAFDGDHPTTPEEDEGEWDAATQRFLYPQYLGLGFLHVDASPQNHTNDVNNLSWWGMESWPTLHAEDKAGYRNFLLTGQGLEVPPATRQWDGTEEPYPNGTVDVKLNFLYGPFNLVLGDTLNFWHVHLAGGLDPMEAVIEGKKFGEKYRKDSNNGKGWSDEDIAAKNQLLRSKGLTDLTASYHKAREIFDNGMRLPNGLNLEPPAQFDIQAGAGAVELSWSPVNGAVSYNLYRGQGEQDSVLFDFLDAVDQSQTTFTDTSVSRNYSYYYYVTAVDDDGVESTKYLTRSRKPVTPFASRGQTLEEIRVVPNPFVYDPDGNYFPDVDRITFAGLPGPCKITVYTLTGEIIDEIENTASSGSLVWDTKTKYNQYLVSGVYFYHVESTDNKGSATGKFIVIR